MIINSTISRPIVRYHGGKWKLAPWILSHFPEHRNYVEAFGGGGSVLLRKRRSYSEVYNDLDGDIVNLFRVARDNGHELRELLELTPFSREEYTLSCETGGGITDLEKARRTVVRAFMGFGSASTSGQKSGFRANNRGNGTNCAVDWKNYPSQLANVIQRLQGVVIENRPAIQIMQQQDGPDTLHYLDPPYVMSTRSARVKWGQHCYRFEMEDNEHEELLKAVKKVKGMVIISGYDNELYNDLLAGWRTKTRMALADGARERIEKLWLSPNFNTQPSLFE